MNTQSHYGFGDNVAGNKNEFNSYIISGLNSRDLISLIREIMKYIVCKDFAEARIRLDFFKKISNVQPDAVEVVNIISQYLLHVSDDLDDFDKEPLIRLCRIKSLPEEIGSILRAIFIDISSVHDKDFSIQLSREFAEFDNCSFFWEVYYRVVADDYELKLQSEYKKTLLMDDIAFTGLVRGLNRVGDYRRAYTACSILHNRFPSVHAKKLKMYTESCLYASEGANCDIFSIDIEKYKSIDSLVADFFDLGLKVNLDNRFRAAMLINLNIATSFCFEKLLVKAYEILDDISRIDKVSAETISNFFQEFDSSFSVNLNSMTIKPEDYNILCLSILNGSIEFSEVREWIEQGGKIDFENSVHRDFAELNLRSLICDDKYGSDFREFIQKFIINHSDRITEISHKAMLNLCDRMLRIGHYVFVCTLLEKFVHKNSWESPLYQCYLEALFQSDKYAKFIEAVSHFDSDNKSKYILVKECAIYFSTNQYDKSKVPLLELLKRDPEDAEAWVSLLAVESKLGSDKSGIEKTVESMPETILDEYKSSKIGLLYFLAKEIDAATYLSVLADWFVGSPNDMAKILTDIHSSLISEHVEISESKFQTKKCFDGVIYSDGFREYKKILVRDVSSSHPSLLSIDSPIGFALNSMNINDTVDLPGFGKITLIDRLNPIVATFRHAMEIRSSTNDGSDSFRQLNVPSEPVDMISYLTRFIESTRAGEDRINKILENHNIPLSMKLNHVYSSDSFKGAVICLTTRRISGSIKLHDLGVKIDDCNSMFIDFITAAYLALTGYAYACDYSTFTIYMTKDNVELISSWLSDISREDYMTMNLTEQGLVKNTGEDIRKVYSSFIDCLNFLLANIVIVSCSFSDTPDQIAELKRFLEPRVYSTYQESVSRGIPWLNVDHIISGLAVESGYTVIDFAHFVSSFSQKIGLSRRKFGLGFAIYNDLAAPVLYSDILELSSSFEIADIDLVANFVKNIFSCERGKAHELLSFIVKINAVIIQNVQLYSISNNDSYEYNLRVILSERIFNFSCRKLLDFSLGATCESNLALFYSYLFFVFRKNTYILSILQKWAMTFIDGHFLDKEEVNRCFQLYLADFFKSE